MVDRMNYQGLIMPVIADLIDAEIQLGEQNQYSDNSGYIIRDNEDKTGLLYSFVYLYNQYGDCFNVFYEIEFLFTGEVNLNLGDFFTFDRFINESFQEFKTKFQKVYLPLKNKLEGN